jgi:hypothetical protein
MRLMTALFAATCPRWRAPGGVREVSTMWAALRHPIHDATRQGAAAADRLGACVLWAAVIVAAAVIVGLIVREFWR